MKRSVGIIPFIIFLFCGWLAAPAGAQTAATAKVARPAPLYDASKEITLTGTVSNVVARPAAGMIAGGHLIMTTAQGSVDAHVGGRALSGPNAIAVKVGDSVKLVGVMATVNHNQIFLVRTAQAGGRTYTIRNERGFLVPAMTSTRGAAPAARGSLR